MGVKGDYYGHRRDGGDRQRGNQQGEVNLGSIDLETGFIAAKMSGTQLDNENSIGHGSKLV